VLRLQEENLYFQYMSRLSKILLIIVLILGAAFTWLVLKVFPAVSGYGAKNMCSAIYLQHRNPADVIREDLSDFPKSLAHFSFDEKDSSVMATVWGFAERKAIYRAGLGATLVNDYPEAEIRKQVFVLPPKPAVNQDSIPWPMGDKIPDTLPANIDKAQLDRGIDIAFRDNPNDPLYTRAVLVVYKGQIIGERYAKGFDKNTVNLGWSMSKSLTSAMIGILVKAGRLQVDAPAPIPEWKGTDKEKITLKNILQQATGLDFTENYSLPSTVTNMLFSKGDMAGYVSSLPLAKAPGSEFYYSSGNTNLLQKIIRQTVGEKEYPAFPYAALFHKINAYSFLMEPDASGTYIGSSYSYGTARDFARFGLLYMNNGRWNGEQILPEDWRRQTTEPAPAAKQQQYGYQFWLNGVDAKNPGKRIYPDVPADMFYADGYGGQAVYIIPSAGLVVVRLGVFVIPENEFLHAIINAIR
jgi:CubicO group peptidase (beta-lactamase class C family)